MADFHVNEDGSKLQKLTPQQVANRLAAYNADGSFEADLGALWRDAGGVLGPVIEEHAGEELAGAFRERCTGAVDTAWSHGIAAYGTELYRRRRSVPAGIQLRSRLTPQQTRTPGDHFPHPHPAPGRPPPT